MRKGQKTRKDLEKRHKLHGRCVITGQECYYSHVGSLEISLNLAWCYQTNTLCQRCCGFCLQSWQQIYRVVTRNHSLIKFSHTFAISLNFHSSQFFKVYNFRPNLRMNYNLHNLGSRRLKTFLDPHRQWVDDLVLRQRGRLAILLPVPWFQML